MSSGRQSNPVTIQPVVKGYRENALGWEPDQSFDESPLSDITCEVAIHEVKIGEVLQDFVTRSSYSILVRKKNTQLVLY
jgi:hypothetical protein